MANNDVTARKTTEAQLIDRASKDPAFRQELIADPKAVFARELGVEMPDSIQVQVLQETPSKVYLVLPQPVAGSTSELSDTELENVAGGWTASTCISTCGGATCSDNNCQGCL